MEWINVALLAALILVTFWYARSTQQILQENRRLTSATVALARMSGQSLFMQALPVIAHSGGGTMSGDVIDLKMSYVNVGSGPALNTTFAMSYQGVDLLRLETHSIVEPGKDDRVGGRAQGGLAATVFNDLDACVYIAEYEDMFGNRYRTRRERGAGVDIFRLDARGEELALSLTPEMVSDWVEI